MREISCPLKKSWKLRWRKARDATCHRDPCPEAASGRLVDAVFWVLGFDSDTFVSFDDAIGSDDYYNVNRLRDFDAGQARELASRIETTGVIPFWHSLGHGFFRVRVKRILGFPDRPNCATVTIAFCPAIA